MTFGALCSARLRKVAAAFPAETISKERKIHSGIELYRLTGNWLAIHSFSFSEKEWRKKESKS
jgi:hypothetical protein